MEIGIPTLGHDGMKQISRVQDQFQVEWTSCSSGIPSQEPTFPLLEFIVAVERPRKLCRASVTYLDVEVLIDFDSPSKDENPLCQVRKLPHISNALKQTELFWNLDGLHLLPSPLPGRHHSQSNLKL